MRIGADAVDERPHAGRLLASELIVLEIDLMDDFRNSPERRIVQPGMRQEHLEAAIVPFMGEFGIEHVKAQFILGRDIVSRQDEFERCLSIEEAAYQPGAGDAVDMYAL